MKVRSLGLVMSVALFGAAPVAHADVSPWALRLGAVHVGFSTDADISANGAGVPGSNAKASDNSTLGFEVSYDVSPRWTARFLAGVPPKTTLSGTGTLSATGALGKVVYGPAVLSMTYAFADSGSIRPYVGAGINYTIVFKSEDAFISKLEVPSAFGSVLQAGIEFPMSKDWTLALDARKIYVKTKADGVLPAMGGAKAHADIHLDPLVVFASLGMRF